MAVLLEDVSESVTMNMEDNVNELIDAKEVAEEIFDFAANGYEQVLTKGGLRWKKINV